MSIVGQVLDRKDRPAYVNFERVPLEDKAESLKAGHYVAKDVDYALITPPYSKDIFKIKVFQWMLDLKAQVNAERIPPQWMEDYIKSYESWKNGQEIPLKGSPIKGWGVISPAQQETLIRMNVLTVEDLAGVNDEGVRRIGMGGIDLKNKAVAWLSQLKDKGPLTQEIASVKSENAQLKVSVETLQKQVETLIARLSANQNVPQVSPPQVSVVESATITASDILENLDIKSDSSYVTRSGMTPAKATAMVKNLELTHERLVELYKQKFGKIPHHRMKDETIMEYLK